MIRTVCSAAVLCLVWAGCATPPPIATPEEIATAEANDDLQSVYDRVALALLSLDPESDAARLTRENLAQIGQKLGIRVETEALRELEAARLPDGRVPLQAIDQVRGGLGNLEQWDPERFVKVEARLSEESTLTADTIASLRKRLDELGEDQALERLRALEALGELSGSGSTQQSAYVDQRLSILDDMRRRADEALAGDNLDEAQRVLMILQEADPDDASVDERLVEVDERVFERDFWSALERGDPDAAYGAFQTLVSSPSFAAIKPNLEGSAGKMASYFAAEAGAATSAGDLEAAFRWFIQAREMEKALGNPRAAPAPEERAFLDLMHTAFEKAMASSNPGLAWGCLSVIEEIGEMTPSLRRELRETREKVVTAATRRLTAYPFEEAEGTQGEFGEAISSKVIQYLFETIPDDLRIIEREQLQDILRERELGGGDTSLASADYLVQGDVLEAKVDGVIQKGRKTQRVVTGRRAERNPDYEAWLALPEKQRGKRPQPPPTVEQDVEEDISFDVEVQRKVGIFSAAYRVVDAKSARMIFADSVREKAVHEDESREGIELGDFKMEFKLADLPSDVEILTSLADKVSQSIGERIAEKLRDPEEEYLRTAEISATEGNYVAAGENAAYAVVLYERKKKQADGLRERLRQFAVAASQSVLD